MSNMSYCRFENTSRDLADCAQALEQMAAGKGEPLSRSELQAAKDLAATARDLLALLRRHSEEPDMEDVDFDESLDALQEEVAR